MVDYEIINNPVNAFHICKNLCKDYHYSKTCPPSQFYFIVYEDNELVGCITYGQGANRNGAKQFNLTSKECLELTRCCFIKHKNYLSVYISKAHKLLKKLGYKLIYSYSDIRQQHYGTLYKANSFVLYGERKLNGIEIYDNNKQMWVHQRNYWKPYMEYYKERERHLTTILKMY